MAAGVIIGMAALGAAFVALTAKRSAVAEKQDAAPTGGDPIIESETDLAAAGSVVGASFSATGAPKRSQGFVAVDATLHTQGVEQPTVLPSLGGADPSTQPSETGAGAKTTYMAGLGVVETKKQDMAAGGGTAIERPRLPANTPEVRSSKSYLIAKYGPSTDGLTKRQESEALSESGPFGWVW